MAINYLAVGAAALSAFLLGGLWYSVLFQKPWMTANGFTDADLKKGNEAAIFGTSLVLCLIMAANLAAFLSGPETTAGWGATAGALTGFGWIAPAIGVVALFERRPLAYALVNGGYWAVALTLMGAILGVWR